MRFSSILSTLILCACVHPSLPNGSQLPTAADDLETANRVAAQFDTLRESTRIPGLAVVILRDTKVILARGYGFANLEKSDPVTPDTPFNIASVTKPLSAVVALRLVERGQLDMDRPLTSYDGFTNYCADVTQSRGLFFSDFMCDRFPMTLRNLLSMQVNGVPGTRFFYNPPAFSWASRPMAQMAGIPFSTLMANEVFAVAGMTDSARIHRQLVLRPDLASRLATPYHTDENGRIAVSAAPPSQGDGAAGGVISTAMDLARFDIALTEGRLLTKDLREVMWSSNISPSGATLPYGLGWYVQTYGGESLYWHSGLWDGAYSAIYLKVPRRKLTLILLANSEGLKWPNEAVEKVFS